MRKAPRRVGKEEPTGPAPHPMPDPPPHSTPPSAPTSRRSSPATERRLQGGQGQGLATYRELIRNLSTKTRPEGGALGLVLDRWVAATTGDAEDGGAGPDDVMRRALTPLEELVHGFDFTRMLRAYREASLEGDDERKSYVLKWLRGEYRTKTEARAELGCSTIIGDDDWYDYVKLFAAFLTGAGYKGLLVLIDELVNLFKIPNSITRQYNYEKILTMYNDTLQGKARHLGIIMGGTPQSIEDRRRGVFSYEALRSRLTQGRFATEGMRDMLAPIIHLHPLTYEELLVLIEKLQQIHAGYFGYRPRLETAHLVEFLKIEFGRVGADTHLTPREVIRDFIELLDIAYQNPDAPVETLLSGVAGSGDAGGQGAPGEHAVPPTPPATAGRDSAEFAEFTI